jgi:hypothetical protein
VSWNHYAQRLLAVHNAHRYQVTSVVWGNGWAVSVRVQFADHEFYDGVGYDEQDATHAESQAYKRACAKAGIGLHLYGDYWLEGYLTKEPEAPAKRKTASDYTRAAGVHIADLVGGDTSEPLLDEEVAKAWPLVLEAAGVEKVTTKKEYEAVIRAANETLVGGA